MTVDTPMIEPEEFYPDEDCSRDESVGGDRAGRCALIETCTLRCHIRWLEGESQPNDPFIDFGLVVDENRP